MHLLYIEYIKFLIFHILFIFFGELKIYNKKPLSSLGGIAIIPSSVETTASMLQKF